MAVPWFDRFMKKMWFSKGFAHHEYTTRPMTPREIEHFQKAFELMDQAFDKMNEAFSEMDDAFFRGKK